jgi:hypothetical protein
MNESPYKDKAGKLVQHRYWNANGANILIVAHEGGAKDYAAYIGARPGWDAPDTALVPFVLEHGDKIEQSFAEFLFPSFKELGLTYRQ